MKNKHVGILIILIAVLIGFIVYSYNETIKDIMLQSCQDIHHGLQCPMIQAANTQTAISIGIIAFIAIIGIYLIFFGKEERIITRMKIIKPQVGVKEITRERYRDILDSLSKDERLVFGKIIDKKGSILQSELVKETGLSKVKVTRILDGLEARGMIERKRRGMTNIVVLKSE